MVAYEGDLVCVAAEANAWPYASSRGARASADAAHFPDELVHLVAVRLSTGERLERVVRPTNPLAPSTEAHTALSRAELAQGAPLADHYPSPRPARRRLTTSTACARRVRPLRAA